VFVSLSAAYRTQLERGMRRSVWNSVENKTCSRMKRAPPCAIDSHSSDLASAAPRDRPCNARALLPLPPNTSSANGPDHTAHHNWAGHNSIQR
jgi:hypothetical protein